jgi:hypothetical protein
MKKSLLNESELTFAVALCQWTTCLHLVSINRPEIQRRKPYYDSFIALDSDIVEELGNKGYRGSSKSNKT